MAKLCLNSWLIIVWMNEELIEGIYHCFQNGEDFLSSRESVVMITKDNEKYRCILPKDETLNEVSWFNIGLPVANFWTTWCDYTEENLVLSTGLIM